MYKDDIKCCKVHFIKIKVKVHLNKYFKIFRNTQGVIKMYTQ